jgi:hypothetical protein
VSYCNNQFEVVIARYNEDSNKLSQLIAKEFPNEKVTVYNKGLDNLSLPNNAIILPLPNIGREAHTYLHHILENYDQLADRILFMQAYPYDHKPASPLLKYKTSFNSACKNIYAICGKGSFGHINNHLKNADWSKGKWHDTELRNDTFIDYANNFLNKDYADKDPIYWSPGAIFAVDKANILCHLQEFHQNILDTLDGIAPIGVHYMERLWDEWANCN